MLAVTAQPSSIGTLIYCSPGNRDSSLVPNMSLGFPTPAFAHVRLLPRPSHLPFFTIFRPPHPAHPHLSRPFSKTPTPPEWPLVLAGWTRRQAQPPLTLGSESFSIKTTQAIVSVRWAARSRGRGQSLGIFGVRIAHSDTQPVLDGQTDGEWVK